jgi:hypothetical protein
MGQHERRHLHALTRFGYPHGLARVDGHKFWHPVHERRHLQALTRFVYPHGLVCMRVRVVVVVTQGGGQIW